MKNERFQDRNRSLFCIIRNPFFVFKKKVSKLALVLLLNINDLFHGGIQSVLCSLRNPFFVFKKSIKSIELVRRSGFR